MLASADGRISGNGADDPILRIGLASDAETRRSTGASSKTAEASDLWLPSLAGLGQLLSAENVRLLEIIRAERPRSIAALAALTGRQPSNLARTLRTMERYGLIRASSGRGKSKPPIVVSDRLVLLLPRGESDIW
jgi:predicted transcriptional regulator